MTNSSPQEPQNPIPERRKRHAAGVTFDEMIAIIVAFSTIGAILFWALGGKDSKFAGNFGLDSDDNFLSLDENTDTGLGFGNILLGDSSPDVGLEQNLELENSRLADRLRELETPVAYVPPDRELEFSPQIQQEESYQFDSGALLVPLTGDATVPEVRTNPPVNIPNEIETETEVVEEPQVVTPPETEVPEPQPEATTPQETETATTEMPDDLAPAYWAYPFVKQMNEQLTIAEFADDQNFEPDKLITRAGMATLISQAFDRQPTNENIKEFKDVTNQNAIAADIDKAVGIGFMQGYSDDIFRPLENIPRYQVLVSLATGLGLEPSQSAEEILQQFNDGTDIPDWAKQQVAAAVESGLVVNPPGVSSNSLNPNESATRGEVAAMIHQALVQIDQIEPMESEYIVQP